MSECLMCGTEINQEGDCPNGCTESEDYGVMQGYYADEVDLRTKSIAGGVCQECSGEMKCSNGCYSPGCYSLGDNPADDVALKKGLCPVCGEKVKCANGCFG